MEGNSGMSFLITGASSGIGFALLQQLSQSGHEISIVCRNEIRAAKTIKALQDKQIATKYITPLICDLADSAEVIALGNRLAQEFSQISTIIHCAGVWPYQKKVTRNGFELAFATNHIAPFLLNSKLVKITKNIVQVSAGLALGSNIDYERTPSGQDFHGLKTYARTKLWNLLATLKLRQEFPDTRIALVHPGVIRSHLGELPGLKGLLLKQVKKLWKPPLYGANNILAMVSILESTSPIGDFYHERKPIKLPGTLNQPSLWRKVSEETARLTSNAKDYRPQDKNPHT